MPDGYFFNSKFMGSSQFWQGLHKVKHLFQWGGIGKWVRSPLLERMKDTWTGDIPLSIRFPGLFNRCAQPDNRIVDMLTNGEWELVFRRSLYGEEIRQLMGGAAGGTERA